MATAGTKRPGSPGLDAADSRPQQLQRTELSPSKDLFASPVITLEVGPDKKTLTAHRSILTKVEYFASCLAPDRYVEGQTNTIALPEDDFDAIAQVLHYLYYEKLEHAILEPCPKRKTPEVDRQARAVMGLCCKTYVAANKLCMEALCNLLVDWFAATGKDWYLTINQVDQHFKRGLEQSSLFRLLTSRLAWAISGKWQWAITQKYPKLEEHFERYPRVGLAVARALASKDVGIKPWLDKCQWHVHERTSKCVQENA